MAFVSKVSRFCQSVGFTNKDNNKSHMESLSPLRGFAFLFSFSLYSSLEFSHCQSTICVCVAPSLPILVFLNQFYVGYLSVVWLNKETARATETHWNARPSWNPLLLCACCSAGLWPTHTEFRTQIPDCKAANIHLGSSQVDLRGIMKTLTLGDLITNTTCRYPHDKVVSSLCSSLD